MAPNRKPPPRLTSPPPQPMSRKPSLHTGHDEQGRPVAWGASRARTTNGLSSVYQAFEYEQQGLHGNENHADTQGEEAVGLLQPTPRREGEGEALSNFEAAVQALRSSAGAGRSGTSSVGSVSTSGTSASEASSAPSRRSVQSNAPHYVKRSYHQAQPLDIGPTQPLNLGGAATHYPAPVDPNYPTTIQFHKSAGYISVPTVKPVTRTNGYQALNVGSSTVGIGSGLPDLPVYRPNGAGNLNQSSASDRGLPMPVSMMGNKNQTGLGIGLHPSRAEEEDGPTSTARMGNGRNVSGPLRRRGRRSRSPTPFADEDEDEEASAKARTDDKENTIGRPDPFGSIEVDLDKRRRMQEKAELTAIYDTAVKRQALKKGYAMYVDVEDGTAVGSEAETMLGEKDMGELEMMEAVPRYPYSQTDEEKRRSADLASYHTKDPRSSVYAPFDHAGETDGLDIGDYKHADGPNDLSYRDDGGEYEDDEDEDEKSEFPPSSTAHFGPAPQGRVIRRHLQKKAKKVVELTEGNLVIDLKIPTKLEGFLPAATRGRMGEDGDEVLYTRYSAVTSTPDDFIAENFTLRQTHYERETELMIVITMYNEDEILFLRTLHGVMRNIGHLEGRKNSGTWGPGSWKKVVVCIVADGRKNISPRVLDCLASLGVYQEGAMKNSVQDKPVQAHVFEYTCTMGLTPDMKFKFASTDKGMVPTQIIFCLKEKNAKKINSHRWFFNGFCRSLEPKVCILLDVGTRPGPKSLYHLWKAFDQNSQVGGACGEVAVYKGRAWKSLLNPLVACQNFEYKISNVLDKTTESVFGYCAVLPGAFSAYRWLALQNDTTGKGPLASYFKGEVLHGRNADMFTANMYLAEDRILCWEIVAKPKHNYVLKYVSAAVGETDAPEAIPEFISQRRRWLNGSFFAAVYALTHVFDLFKTEHSFLRKMALLLQAFYNAIMIGFSWFSLANFYIFFMILTSALEDPAFGIPKISILNAIMQYTYLGTVIACFIFSMGNRPQGSVWKYTSAVIIFAVLTLYMIAAAIVCMVQAFKNIHDPIFAQMIVSVVSTYAVFVIASILAFDPFHLLTSFGQYILFQASSINILNVYGFANTDDVSWGTKGADTTQNDLGAVKGVGNEVEVELLADQHDVDAAYSEALDNLRVRKPTATIKVKSTSEEEQARKDYYANVRTNVLLGYVLSNALLASVILGGSSKFSTFSESSSRTSVYMLCILIFVAGTNLFRLIGAILYLLMGLVSRLRGFF